ncbi:MAG: phytanoyl-CoA dioxygenase family protein [Armatimonadetes bacterium]|nr:phytanoyl-CoA dioxygenase family protein [Armatimonadota bacterium]
MATSHPLPSLLSCGKPLDASEGAFGWLRESLPTDDGLTERLQEDGYLYLRGLIPVDLVLRVREQVLGELRERGLLAGEDFVKLGATISAFQPELVEQNVDVTRVMFGEELHAMMERLHGEPVMHYQYVWFRSLGRGMGTAPHCDVVYMGRGTHRIFTSWVPFGAVDPMLGGLMILEGSHQRRDLTGDYLAADVDSYCVNGPAAEKIAKGEMHWEHYQKPGESWDGSFSHDPAELQKMFGGRWLTAREYQPGDVLIFTMGTVHASLDNQTDRLRISSDVRYQPVSEPVDERYAGDSPIAHGIEAKRGRIC